LRLVAFRVVSLISLALAGASCQKQGNSEITHTVFKMCDRRLPDHSVEINLRTGLASQSDLLGRVESCGPSKTCMMFPFVMSAPPKSFKQARSQVWSDGAYTFHSKGEPSADEVSISTDVEYRSSAKVGTYTQRLVYRLSDGVQSLVIDDELNLTRCAGQLRLEDMQRLLAA